jgi:G:T-mismatch repair DNA endonuclease (very short patch repair protein)
MKRGEVRYPEPSTAMAAVIMRANRPTETGPERGVRSALHRAGERFRKNVLLSIGEVRTRPDVVFGPARGAKTMTSRKRSSAKIA